MGPDCLCIYIKKRNLFLRTLRFLIIHQFQSHQTKHCMFSTKEVFFFFLPACSHSERVRDSRLVSGPVPQSLITTRASLIKTPLRCSGLISYQCQSQLTVRVIESYKPFPYLHLLTSGFCVQCECALSGRTPGYLSPSSRLGCDVTTVNISPSVSVRCSNFCRMLHVMYCC